MDDFVAAEEAFTTSLNRARILCDLQAHLESSTTEAVPTSDLLRAAVVLCVSAYDYLAHEVFRIETWRRACKGEAVLRLQVPSALIHLEGADLLNELDRFVRERNSFRSFVDPGKFAEAMSCLVDGIWDRVATHLSADAHSVKKRVRAIYQWRNRIAHEADINPTMAGIELWPIDREDVTAAIDDFEQVGGAILTTFRRLGS